MIKTNIVVFDFDKTLTYNDTLFNFYCYVSKKNIHYPLRVILYIIYMILFKCKIISNDYLKLMGFNLFLRGLRAEYLDIMGKKFISKINFNNLFKSYNFNTKNKKFIVVSASYEIYLKYIFPKKIDVYGSQFKYKNGFASEFLFNCYSSNKKFILNKNGINSIETLYTDSYSDKSLATISKKIIIVDKDTITKCDNINEFNLYFKK